MTVSKNKDYFKWSILKKEPYYEYNVRKSFERLKKIEVQYGF
ncbi:hypothetical protein RYE81_15650 [Clostridioides difficile]|uniref:Uncharacterized protein n=1 Tax=Clostridioides difficile NAP08 TaxID=525259 RepID=D5Q0N8_CLODI|nr:hypothetical protein [Clostridioides difficile]EFH08604.1 hypothetical protein HMPREF0220_0470 [Clostridioides difficile NAP08]EFH16601.1 hypothetical protein HMPREF0219_0769 [Clostridioides difficile NAP07]CCK89440.1 conserved hypothetical protein [Clostridioides difficile T5]CCK92948.1 conserved hypothetical protein [Clostridioides difficile T20]CCK96576.1 conserved hypothetical protein [Clostridioides difficile E1]